MGGRRSHLSHCLPPIAAQNWVWLGHPSHCLHHAGDITSLTRRDEAAHCSSRETKTFRSCSVQGDTISLLQSWVILQLHGYVYSVLLRSTLRYRKGDHGRESGFLYAVDLERRIDFWPGDSKFLRRQNRPSYSALSLLSNHRVAGLLLDLDREHRWAHRFLYYLRLFLWYICVIARARGRQSVT